MTRFARIDTGEYQKVYHAMVYSKSLKTDIDLVVVKTNKKAGCTHKLYFSTDLALPASDILEYYSARFRIAFLLRDAKQHTWLDHC